MLNESSLVVYSGVIAEWAVVKTFCNDESQVRKATREEVERWDNRPSKTPDNRK